MVTEYVACDGYQVLAREPAATRDAVVARCRALSARDGGAAVIALQAGRVVADATGWFDDRRDSRRWHARTDIACAYFS